MAIQYTNDELKIIDKNKKSPEEKPRFYNSTTDQTEVVSDDFEAYLILQQQATKQQILQRLRQNIKINNDTTDRDVLLKIFSDNIVVNADKKMAELDIETQNYDTFRDSVVGGDRRFDSLKELNRLLTVIKKPIEELTFMRDQVFHDGNVNILISDRLEASKSDANTKKEFDVWQKVISAYQGR